MHKLSPFDEAETLLETAVEAAEDARRAIAKLPGAPRRYWAGLSSEAGPLAEGWLRTTRAIESLQNAGKDVESARRIYHQQIMEAKHA